jgi:hypothetical protein
MSALPAAASVTARSADIVCHRLRTVLTSADSSE